MKKQPRSLLYISLFLFLIFFIGYPLESIGQNRPSIDWKVINTGSFEIIFPSKIEKDAHRVANTLEHIYPHIRKTVRAPKKRITIVLYNRLSQSNGYATIAPRKSVWYNVPTQSGHGGVTDWYNHLSIHEYRHILQFDSLNRGFGRVFYYIAGDYGLALSMFMAIPQWFFEGDSVLAETTLTKGGRGRVPQFLAPLKAELLGGKKYSYYQSNFGTYKGWNTFESPYKLGYLMVSKIRREFGAEKMMRIGESAMNWAILPHRYSVSVRGSTGKFVTDYYDDMLKEVKGIWTTQIEGLKVTEAKGLHKINKDEWTKNSRPQYLKDGEVIVYRYGMDDIPQIVKINKKTGDEEFIARTGFLNIAPSVAGSKIVWSEEIPHVRWTEESSSDIYVADIEKDSLKRLTSGGKYFAPALSPDMKNIAAVEFSIENRSSIVILNAHNGKLIKRIPNETNDFIQTPQWDENGNSIVYCKTRRLKGKGIYKYNFEKEEEKELIPFSYEDVQTPVIHKKYLYYVSPYSGIDNVYAKDLKTGEKYQVTSRKFGAYSPSLNENGEKLAFSDVTAHGYEAVEMNMDKNLWTPIDKVEIRKVAFYQPIVDQEAGRDIMVDIPENKYEVEDYSGFLDLINVHSWSPYFNTYDKEISVYLYSNNILNTTTVTAGYVFNWNEYSHTGVAAITYRGWFPVLRLYGNYGTRASTYKDRYNRRVFYNWREASAGFAVALPFNFSRRRWSRSFEVEAEIEYTYISDQEVQFRYENNNGFFVPLSYQMRFTNTTEWNRDLNPRWGQVLSVRFSHTPIKEADYYGYLLSANGSFYFPGIFKNNSLSFKANFEMQDGRDYRFSSLSLFPRGYDYDFYEKFFIGSINYTFPIWYPDLNLLWAAYIKRIYMNIFLDYGLEVPNTGAYYRSAGGELVFEFKPLGYNFTLFLGARYSYLLDRLDDPHSVGLVFGIEM